MVAKRGVPALPQFVQRKLYKTGQTRGADVKQIYQNRVARNSTVLIPFPDWDTCGDLADRGVDYENGFIVLVSPSWYFSRPAADAELADQGLELGVNALLFYQKRSDWDQYGHHGTTLPNGKVFEPALNRRAPLGGVYVARIHGTTASGVPAVVAGYNETSSRGAGIRVYEYASEKTLADTRLQLEALIWLCSDAVEAFVEAGMSRISAVSRKDAKLREAEIAGLLDYDRLLKTQNDKR